MGNFNKRLNVFGIQSEDRLLQSFGSSHYIGVSSGKCDVAKVSFRILWSLFFVNYQQVLYAIKPIMYWNEINFYVAPQDIES